MKKILNNFLQSGHSFTQSENLHKFRFSMLNSMLLIASIFAFINYLASFSGFVVFPLVFERAVLAYAVLSLVLIYALRQNNKNNFIYAVIFILSTSFALFYISLVTDFEDEFRLIWFFLLLFASAIFLGKKFSAIITVFVFLLIFTASWYVDIAYSKTALFTFFNSFLIFLGFVYSFLHKIEKDALEYEVLSSKLKNRVIQERQQREEQEQMLLRQCRMANMGEMLDTIAHQWRQPLMHINSILLNMDNSPNVDNKHIADKIDEISDITTHMSNTIEDFRGLFKSNEEQTQFLLHDVIAEVLALMKNSLNDINLEYNNGQAIILVGNKSELMQVIIILLSNAVEALNKDINKDLIIKAKQLDTSISISIEDNAKGINPDNLQTIFDPYFTTKKQSGGTGLGLYIAKIIVNNKMSGTIKAENTKIGARFIVTIPKHKPLEGKQNVIIS